MLNKVSDPHLERSKRTRSTNSPEPEHHPASSSERKRTVSGQKRTKLVPPGSISAGMRPRIPSSFITSSTEGSLALTADEDYDLYAQHIEYLADLYLPRSAKTAAPAYSALYNQLLFNQSKSDQSGTLSLSSGLLSCDNISDPLTLAPLPIKILTLTVKPTLTFAATTERPSFVAAEIIGSHKGPGFIAQLSISAVGIKSAKGTLKMTQVWSLHGQKLYEGFLSFRVVYNDDYRKKGYGNGAGYKFAFWAINSLKEGDIGRAL